MSEIEPQEPQAVLTLTTPAFSSNDPATEGLLMIPVDDSPESEFDPSEAADFKAGDWKNAVNDADNAEALAEVVSAYEASGADFSSVKDAIAKKQSGFATDVWVTKINAAADQDALDAVLGEYDEAEDDGADEDAVTKAGEARQAALDSASNGQ